MNTYQYLMLLGLGSGLALSFGVSYGQSVQPVPENTPTNSPVVGVGSQSQGALQNMRYHYAGVIRREDAVRLDAIRRAGLEGDNSRIGDMVEGLKNPPHPMYPYAALHSLAQLGATGALPTVESYLSRDATQSDSELNNYARVARARLLAEAAARNIAGNASKAKAKVERFYAELGLTPDDLRTAAQTVPYRSPRFLRLDGSSASFPNMGAMATPSHDIHSVVYFAVRELADIVYQGAYQDFASLPGVAQANFSLNSGAALKMRLAPFSEQQRVSTMIQELSHKTVLRNEDEYEIQLAINEGTVASRAAAAELQKMAVRRGDYNQIGHHIGFTALFQVIAGVGDKDQAALIGDFTHDSDTWVAYYAHQVYPDVSNGIPRQPMWGY